jgi:hypothetical protein
MSTKNDLQICTEIPAWPRTSTASPSWTSSRYVGQQAYKMNHPMLPKTKENSKNEVTTVSTRMLKSRQYCGRRSDGQLFLMSGPFNFHWLTITFFLLHLGLPLWREDGSIICSAVTHWIEPRRTHNHILLSYMRLLQPGGPGPHIYILQEHGGPVIPPGTGFPFRRLLRLAGLRRRYTNPPPHGANSCCISFWWYIYIYKRISVADRLCGLVVGVPSYRSRGPGFPALPDFLKSSGSVTWSVGRKITWTW